MESLLERERQLRKLNEELDEQQVQVDRQSKAALMPSKSLDAENVKPEFQSQPQPKSAAKPGRSPTRGANGTLHVGTGARRGASKAPLSPPTSMASSSLPSPSPTRGGGAHRTSDAAADDEPETDELAGMVNMGVEATIRMQKAQLTVLREELEQMVAAQQDGEEQLATMQAKLDKVQRQQKEGARALAQTEVALEKQRELCKAAELKAAEATRELRAAAKEIEALKRDGRQQQAASGSRDVRLNRALEDVERYKALLAEARSNGKAGSEHARRDHERVISENRKLTRQKAELLNAFKKQLKLIDVLKRQKLHMEAAKMLSFTEDEFSRILSS